MKIKITIILFVLSTNVSAQNLNFKTFDFSAEIIRHDIPNCEISAALDSENKTHIVWIKTIGTSQSLMYSVYDNTNLTTQLIVTGQANQRLAAPSLILDNNNHPHIVYITKRDNNIGTKSGNYAIVYVGDANGDGSFTTSQVSTNSTNPNDDTDNIFNAYVNGRPNIAVNNLNNELTVFYYADASSLTSFENWIVSARGNGQTWQHQEEYSLDDLPGGEPSPSNDVNIDRRGYNTKYHGMIEIGNYNPLLVAKGSSTWAPYRLTQYGGFGNTEGLSIEVENNGNAHMFWFVEDSAKFVRANISDQGVSNIKELQIIGKKSQTSNFRPSVLDDVTGKWWMSYIRSSGTLYIMTEGVNGQAVEVPLTNIGTYYGKRCLNVRNGFLSLVTASEGNGKIYVTTNAAATSIDNNKLTEINVFPNPSNDFINIKLNSKIDRVEICDLDGRLVLIGEEAEMNIQGLSKGLYILKAITDEGVYTSKFVKN